MFTPVVVYKPVVVMVDTEDCKTVGDLIKEVNEEKQDLVDLEDDELLYMVDDKRRGPVAFSRVEVSAPLANNPGQMIHLLGRVRELPTITVRAQGFDFFPDGAPEWRIMVDLFADIDKLQKKLSEIGGGLPDCMLLWRNGEKEPLEPSLDLAWQGVKAGDVLDLKVDCGIVFLFLDEPYLGECTSDQPMYDVLAEFAEKVGEDLSDLRFTTYPTSGERTYRSLPFVPNHEDLFEASSVVGTMQENGSVDGDYVDVVYNERADEEDRDE